MMTERFIKDVRTLGEVFTFSDMIDLYQDDYDMYCIAPGLFQMFIDNENILPMHEKCGEQRYKLNL